MPSFLTTWQMKYMYTASRVGTIIFRHSEPEQHFHCKKKANRKYLDKYLRKYYSPTVTHGKTFVDEFCTLQIDSTQLFKRHKIR
jgi:hypothetical protein